MKVISADNYYEPDEAIGIFSVINYETGEQWKVTEKDILNFAEEIHLLEIIPKEIIELIEVSKALFVYGYLYWTFFSLAREQSFKAFEAAITKVHETVYGSNYSSNSKRKLQLSDMIQRLIKSGNIPQDKKSQYKAIRELRNISFHPSSQSQWGLASLDTIKLIVDEINSLFLSLQKS